MTAASVRREGVGNPEPAGGCVIHSTLAAVGPPGLRWPATPVTRSKRPLILM